MANGWSASEYKLGAQGPVSGVVTNLPVTSEFPITAGGALNMAIKVTATGVTVAGSITAKLQTAIGSDWVDSKTVAITTNGSVYLKLNIQVAADQTFLPLLNKGRIVLTTTNAGDAATVSSVKILQAL